MKAILAALLSATAVYLAFCFGQATFDISSWPTSPEELMSVRAMCGASMLLFGAMAFCFAKSIETLEGT